MKVTATRRTEPYLMYQTKVYSTEYKEYVNKIEGNGGLLYSQESQQGSYNTRDMGPIALTKQD